MDRAQREADDATFRHMNQHDNEEHEHEHQDDDIDDEHSPESAGLARGLARGLASRSAVGRLPVASQAAKTAKAAAKSTARTHVKSSGMRVRPRATMAKPTSTAMAGKVKMRGGGTAGRVKVRSPATAAKSAGGANKAIKVPPSRGGAGGSRVNVRRIARASDRASTGLDLVEAASSEDTVTVGNKSDIGGRLKDVMRRIPSFMATLAKNTVLGMAVFAAYERVVECELPTSSSSPSSSPAETNDDVVASDPFATASLSRHVTAGLLAGTAHAGVNYTMDALVRMRHTMFAGAAKGVRTATAPFVPYTMHHAISHGVLFGSYEGTKRVLMSTFGSDGKNRHTQTNYDEDTHYSDLLAIGLAGGIAGTLQHVVSEYTETTFVTSYSQIWQAKGLTFSERLQLFPRASMPSARALGMAFVPSSIGFVAFEYGKEFLTDGNN